MDIPLDRFEQVIDARILERGLKYFESGAVQEPEELETGLYEAVVEGSDDYTVQLRVAGDAITEHTCDCPYDGAVCKHVVALIFELQQGALDLPKRGQGKTAKKPTVAQQVDRALAAVPHDELIAFVRARAMADPAFRQHFLIQCAPQAITQGRHDHLKGLRADLRAVAGRGGYFGWDETFAAASVLHDMLGKAEMLIKKGHPQRALPLISAVIEAGAEAMQNADDSNGDLGGGLESAMEMLEHLAKAEHEEAFRKELLGEVVRLHTDKNISDYDFNDHLEPTAAALVRTPEEAAPLMASLKRSANADYGGSSARDALLDLTRRFEGQEAASALEDSLLVHSDVRERAIEAAIKVKDWARARKLAEEGRQVRRNGQPATHAHYWTPHLLRIAQLTKDSPEVVRLARTLLLDSHHDGMEYYKLLREHVPTGEWPAFVDKLLGDLRSGKGHDRQLIADICAAEERWDEVMVLARAEPTMPGYYQRVLDQYEQELARHYREEVITLLAERAEAFASKPEPKYDNYVDATKLLRRMIKLGDRQLADALAADWRVRLKRRTGLMTELGKL